MNKSNTLINLIKRFWIFIEVKRKKQFFLLVMLMLITSFIEVLTIGAVVPFLGVLFSPEKIISNVYIHNGLSFIGIEEKEKIQFLIMLIFCLLVILSGLLRYILLLFKTTFSFSLGSELSTKIYRTVLSQPYKFHVSQNTSQIINAVMIKANGAITLVLHPILEIIISLMLLLTATILILAVSIKAAMIILTMAILLYFSTAVYTKKRLTLNGEKIAILLNEQLKYLQEGYGGIRDVILSSTQEYFCDLFRMADRSLRRAQADNLMIGSTPKYIIETICTLVIAVVAYYFMLDDGEILIRLPIFLVIIISLQKIFSQTQILYGSWALLRGNQASLQDMVDLLEKNTAHSNAFPKVLPEIEYKKFIRLNDIYLSYESRKTPVLNRINFSIKKGSIIGIIGKTGAGKSSVLDILMGLMTPTSGKLTIDEISIDDINRPGWQSQIAHVPQSIYMADATILENIAFGIKSTEIDITRVKYSAKIAQIADEIEGWELGYETNVGERGAKISGGQRQRIGIARAIYRGAQVLILDEATNALDVETEDRVMKNICELVNTGLTIILVSHSRAALKYCHETYQVSNGGIIKI